MRRGLEREIKATEPRNPDLAAWLKVELAALPPQSLVFAAASDFRPRQQPRAARQAATGARAQARRYPPARQAGCAGTLSCVDGLPPRFSDRSRRRRIGPPRSPGAAGSPTPRIRSPGGRSSTACGNGISAAAWFRPPATSAGWAACHRIPSCSTGWRRRFLESGGSLKALHRLIVTSAVYRQSVRARRSHSLRSTATTSGYGGKTAAGSTPRASTTRFSPSPASSIPQWEARRSSSFALRPGVHVTPVVDYSQYDWSQPRLAPAQRLSLYFPHASRPVLRRTRLRRRVATDGRAQRVDHAPPGTRALE